MTENDINRLIGRAATNQKFASQLVDPKTRLDALNTFQEGREEGVVYPEREPSRGSLTPWEMSRLMKIDAEDIETFARGAQEIIEEMKRDKK